jgi:flagellar motor switch protein FliN/FliY
VTDVEPLETDGPPSVSPAALLEVEVRLSAELGRAVMPAAAAVGLHRGEVVDLDRTPDDPVDLYVNGRRYGTGRILLVDGEWAVRIESLKPRSDTAEEAGVHPLGVSPSLPAVPEDRP